MHTAVTMGKLLKVNCPHPPNMPQLAFPQFHRVQTHQEEQGREKERNLESPGRSCLLRLQQWHTAGCSGLQQQKLAVLRVTAKREGQATTLGFKLMVWHTNL